MQSWKVGNYNGVNSATSSVIKSVNDCEGNFRQPPAGPSALPRLNEELKDLCSITLVISNMIPRPSQ